MLVVKRNARRVLRELKIKKENISPCSLQKIMRSRNLCENMEDIKSVLIKG